jgi:hypothetical protein
LYDYVLTHSRMNESQKNTTKVEAFEIWAMKSSLDSSYIATNKKVLRWKIGLVCSSSGKKLGTSFSFWWMRNSSEKKLVTKNALQPDQMVTRSQAWGRGQTYNSFYTLGWCKIKCLNCCFHLKEKNN